MVPLAIYHCSLKVFTRSKGQSAVAAAAYRSGTTLYDERYEKLHRYENRSGISETFLLLPENTEHLFACDDLCPDQIERQSGLADRAALWNAVEASETRKNSCVARELVLALPHELCEDARAELSRDMSSWLVQRYRVAVDVAIHVPVDGHHDDPRNHHAHLLFSTRELTEEGFGKKTRILDDKVTGKEETEVIREVWEALANEALRNAGHTDVQIDRRTLEDQGIDRIPQTHIGPGGSHGSDSIEDKLQSEETEEDSEEEEGKGSSSSGGAGGGGEAPAGFIQESSESKKHKEDAVLDDEYRYRQKESLSRREFVEEIKRLNEQRAGFSDIPLADQIEHLDKLMDKLDVRASHLERLKERSGLGHRLKRSLEKLLEVSAAAVLNRQSSSKTLSLNAAEKQARAQRQKAHYGRSYRQGLHSRIKEMKQNISLLKSKQEEYQRYKGFVEKIESAMHDHPSIPSPSQAPKVISNEESRFKLALKANLAREKIPENLRSNSGDKLKVKSKKGSPVFRNGPSDTTRIKTKITPENNKIDLIVESKRPIALGYKAKAQSQKALTGFKEKASNVQAEKGDYKQKIKDFDPVKASKAREEAQSAEPKKSTRESWFTKGTEKTRPMTESIARKIEEVRKDRPVIKVKAQPNRERVKGEFEFKADKISRASNEVHRTKIKAEAETKREKVPEQYKAEPYEDKKVPEPQGEDLKGQWKGETKTPEDEPEAKPRVKMSFGFNEAVGMGRDGGLEVDAEIDETIDVEPEV